MKNTEIPSMKTLNRIHRYFWVSLSIAVAVGALLYNPCHLFTASVLLLIAFGAKFEERD